jgi:hypothetical protein
VIRAISWKEIADLREENARLRRAVYDMQNSLARLTEINKLNYENSVFITEGIQKIIQTSEKNEGCFWTLNVLTKSFNNLHEHYTRFYQLF